MNCKYYAGHDFFWIQQFLDVIPKSRWYHKNIAYSLACCIHHYCLYEGSTTIKLTHKKLKLFGLNRQTIKRYLEKFQQANLINVVFQNKRAPIVTLLLVINNKHINKSRHRTHVEKHTCFNSSQKLCNQIDEVTKLPNLTNQTNEATKLTNQLSNTSKGGN